MDVTGADRCGRGRIVELAASAVACRTVGPERRARRGRRTTMSIYLGRQPILDASRRRHGYELLYRNGNVDSAFFADPHDATRRVVEQALLEWGLADLVGDGMAFINVTSQFLQSGMFTVLPP